MKKLNTGNRTIKESKECIKDLKAEIRRLKLEIEELRKTNNQYWSLKCEVLELYEAVIKENHTLRRCIAESLATKKTSKTEKCPKRTSSKSWPPKHFRFC